MIEVTVTCCICKNVISERTFGYPSIYDGPHPYVVVHGNVSDFLNDFHLRCETLSQAYVHACSTCVNTFKQKIEECRQQILTDLVGGKTHE